MYSAGLLFYLVVVNYRMWILYWLLVRMQPIGGRYFYGIFAIMCVLPIIFPILSTAIPGWVYTTNGDQPGTCMYSPGYSVLFCVALYYLTVVAITLAILLRNVRKSFNEYLETMISTAGFTVLVIVMGVTGMKVFWLHSWGRFIMLNLSLIAVNLYFWASLARPLYGFLFDRQNYLTQFQETLAMDGLAEFKSSSGTASRADNGTTLKGSVTETMTPMEEDVVVAMPSKKDVVYPASVSDAELTDVRSLFAPTKPMDEKSYLV
ncbi:hypothetical protein IWQ60_006686 [Tieghemiomyces parasiticus]|uniref:Uncharacterized protein n=1 Tax=Tieghemiomyces parasiticus TaxID=78921 RepID=A0A9W8A3R6_9FUNG|nr:hypothetical protein IWQ60_006686 [Tieghemiomyces parasiticus]